MKDDSVINLDHHTNLVSIIIATYNRPNVLQHAVTSALYQDYSNIEVLVIGDCCNSETEEILSEFSDSRLKYFNLPENCGEQSGPNNYGMSIARGKYFAFLNHDDIYFPDHISSLVRTIKDQQCALAYSLFSSNEKISKKRIKNVMLDGRFDVHEGHPASTWLYDREVYQRTGEWVNFRSTYDVPSQEWIGRVYKNGTCIRSSNYLSIVIFRSSFMKKSYVTDDDSGQKEILRKMKSNPDKLRSELLTNHIALFNYKTRRFSQLLYLICLWIAKRILKPFGIRHPAILAYSMVNFKKGILIDKLRKQRGLHKLE